MTGYEQSRGSWYCQPIQAIRETAGKANQIWKRMCVGGLGAWEQVLLAVLAVSCALEAGEKVNLPRVAD